MSVTHIIDEPAFREAFETALREGILHYVSMIGDKPKSDPKPFPFQPRTLAEVNADRGR